MGWAFEAKKEIVEADRAVGLETVSHGGKVDGAVVLVDLN